MSKVGIIMGSDSDLPVMKDAAVFLEILNIPYEIDIVSAHRTPDKMYDYAKNAYNSGIRVIIAGAGGAAHLPGMVSALTPLPVIGVPVKSSAMSGIDSLYSIVQMPGGIPVATVAINGAFNAGILAAQILATGNAEIYEKLKNYQESLKNTVDAKSENLQQIGYSKYLEQMGKLII